jgi:hypothetical protein
MTAPFIVPPIFRQFDSAGLPAAGFLLFTYSGGTTTPKVTYSDSAGTVPNTNPVVLDTSGSAVIRGAPGTYNLVLKDSTASTTLWSADQYSFPIYSQSDLGALLYPQTAAEVAAVATPVNFALPPGNVLRYGANTVPGTTDMTAAIQAALNQAGQSGGAPAYLPAGTYLATSQLTVSANSQFYGDGSASIINTSVAANDGILANNVANALIRNIKVNCTATVSGGYYGAIAFRGTTNSKIEGCEVTGGYFAGVVVSATSTNAAVENRVVGNFFHLATNGAQDSADIHVDCTASFGASYNVIDGNYCFGSANWFGISLEASVNPNAAQLRNAVTNNRIGQHITYGIILYTHTPADTYNQIIGNYIENITGTGLTGSGGTGIYVANHTATTVANNIIVNCCNASSVQFTQGGITILSGFAGSANTITGNSVYDMAQTNGNAIVMGGINIISTPPGTVVTGNLVSQQTGFTGYNGIYVQGGNSGCTVTGNTVNILNTIASTRGIYAVANGANLTNVTITGNTVLGCSSRGITAEQSGGFTVNNLTVNGNTVTGGGASSVPLNITSVNGGSISGNTASATTTNALVVSAATNVSFSGNMLTSTGGTTVNLAGTCTGSLFDDSNVINGGVANSATGLQAKQRTAVSPQTLAFASMIGDLSTNTAGATPWGWMCTVTGTPGTWSGLTLP